MMRLDDPDLVRRQYATEDGLAVRRDSQRRYLEGTNAFDVAFAAVERANPGRVLEVGCGMGEFAERVARERRAEVVATDLSPRMVELTAARGLDARVADAQDLPFEDGEFACAVANWMLYHVPDLDRALGELRRVLRPGGTLVATTIGAEHMADVWRLVGFGVPLREFSRESGEALLRRHFARVERRDVDATLVFPDEAAVHRYVESTVFASVVPRPLPAVGGALRSRTRTTVFVAQR
jgi:ubiquinone/menaquinone biosynthesis C-methylase UbiE